MYKAEETFFKYYRKFKEAVYKDKKSLEIKKLLNLCNGERRG
jgi:hypothetical protein